MSEPSADSLKLSPTADSLPMGGSSTTANIGSPGSSNDPLSATISPSSSFAKLDDLIGSPSKTLLIETSSPTTDNHEVGDIEPRLKYSKITQLPKAVFVKDPVSAFLVGDSFFAFATHGGVVHLTKPDFTLIRSYRAHKASILGLSTDGIYLASASIDGTVVIGSVNDPRDISACNFKRPVHTVALDPNYKSSKAFLSGGMAGDVILSERNWLGQRSDTVLQNSEDAVIAVYWLEGLILWMNDTGINIYSQFTKKLLLNIPRPEDSPRADLYKPRICTPESNRIYIAWADRVWNLKITVTKTRDNRSLLSSGASMVFSSASSVRSLAIDQSISIESELHLKCLVAGIAAFKEDSIMLLSYSPPPPATEDLRRPLAPNPQLCLVDLETGVETYSDELSLVGYERLGLNDYHLCQYADSTTTKYLIVSAKDGIVAKERDLGDRVTWLLEHKKFKEAWEFSANFKLPMERYNIGISWVAEMVETLQWQEAIATLELVQRTLMDSDADSKILPLDADADDLSPIEILVRDNWNYWGWIISKAGHTIEIASVLPSDVRLHAEGTLYEFILTNFIDEDKLDDLVSYLKKWSVDLYDFAVIKRYIEDLLNDNPPQEKHLRKTLADLYVSSGNPLSAVPHLLLLQDESVLELVSQHRLLSSLLPQIPDLLTIRFKSVADLELAPLPIIRENITRAITIVVKARHEALPSAVVKQLMKRNMEVVAFLYLEQLNSVDPYACQQFGDLQARLYAEYDRPKLMSFLRKNSNYNYETIANACESRHYIPELVYIYGKIGQNKRALKLIIEELDDAEQAIDFAKDQHDPELWDDLLDYCMESRRPDFIRVVLERASNSIPPASIIARIPLHLHIPGLKDAISRIFYEHELVLSINRGILDIVRREARTYAGELRAERTKGTMLDFVTSDEAEKGGVVAVVATPGAAAATAAGADKSNLPASEKGEKGMDMVDFSLHTLVVLPDGTLHSEEDLLGEDNVWGQQTLAKGISSFASRSVSQKIQHLAYIKKQLQLLIQQS